MLSLSLPRRMMMMMGGGGGRRTYKIVVGVGGIKQCPCGSSVVANNINGKNNGRSARWLANDTSSNNNHNHQNYDDNGGGGTGSIRDRGGSGSGMMMRVYDSLSMSHKPLPMAKTNDSITMASSSSSSSGPPPSQFTTATTRGIAWYICGPTVYDSAHVGHGRTYVTLDILRRVAMHYHHQHQQHGPELLYVMNITDVDDKIIKRSATMMMTTPSSPLQSSLESSSSSSTHTKLEDPIALARYYEHEFWSDMDQLNVLRPNVICRVSEHVESTIVPYIAQIVEGGMAYVMNEEEEEHEGERIRMEDDSTASRNCSNPQGSVYFDVRAFESKARGRTRYGKLAPADALSTTTSNSHTFSSTSNDTTTFFSWEKSNNNTRDGTVGGNNEDEDDAPKVQRIMKRDPRDFCLWKYRPRTEGTRKTPPPPPLTTSTATTTALPHNNNDDEAYTNNGNNIIEPESVSYNSPWGPGRPGWHVECSAMIHRLSQDFQDTHVFAVHAGGIDLRFPHHTNEIAQAEAHRMAGKDGEHNTNSGGGDAKNNNNGRIEEWMQHWLHTGHLHVKGRKMSKSLKNFITIREMLQLDNDDGGSSNDQNNAWHSPSDDFRLWCLGLSGSYRGPATYGKDRMEEARTVREKWVRFLIEGQECLEKWMETSSRSPSCAFSDNLTKNANNDTSHSSTRLWDDEDLSLFRTVTLARVKCHASLVNDLDGATFVRELTDITETGLAYVRQAMLGEENHSTNHERRCRRPEEPLRFVLDFVRSQLDLVGFSPQTVHAGLGVSAPTNVGTPLLDEAVAFRAAIRSTALNAIRQKEIGGSVDALKDILELCDELRDDIFPKFGVEILDGKVAVKSDGDTSSKRGWRHCPPRG